MDVRLRKDNKQRIDKAQLYSLFWLMTGGNEDGQQLDVEDQIKEHNQDS